MKRIALVFLIVLAAMILMTGPATGQARARATSIFMTRNYPPGTGRATYMADCLGSVSTETLPARRGDPISWKVKPGNGHNSDDPCLELNMNEVELVFSTDVMGAAVKRRIKARGGSVDGTVSMSATEAFPGKHKYQVFYKGVAAGPDPEIIVDCPSCGGGRGPGGSPGQ